MSVYLDYNATTPRHPLVKEAMQRAEEQGWANPSSVHQQGRRARQYVEDVREALAKYLSRSPRDIVLTGGGTEANHLALQGARWLVTSRIEHPSIVAQAESLAQQGARVVFADIDSCGVVRPDAVERALDEVLRDVAIEARPADAGGFNNSNTPLVAVMACNHETGVIQPLREIHEVTRARGARLHVDAVQWFGKRSPEHLLHADSLSVAAHKARGPKGVGALVFECGWTPLPLGRGGAQERGLRPGTVDAVAVAGFGAAVSRLSESEERFAQVAQLGAQLEQLLLSEFGQGAVVHGREAERLQHVVNFRSPGWKGDELVVALDLEGICVSSGSACSAGTAEPSSVIQAMLGREAAVGAVRISLGEESTSDDVEALVAALVRLRVLRPDARFCR